MIDPAFIAEVKRRTSLIELIGARVQLKQRGREAKGPRQPLAPLMGRVGEELLVFVIAGQTNDQESPAFRGRLDVRLGRRAVCGQREYHEEERPSLCHYFS